MSLSEPAPPRRKSCEACKTAKRRCDLAFPTCSRCMSRCLPCIYPGRLPTAYQELFNDSPPLMDAADHTWPTTTMPSPFSTENNLCADSTMDLARDSIDPLSNWRQYVSDGPLTTSFDGPLSHTDFVVAIPRTRSLMPLSEIIATHLQFAIDVLQNAPKMMVVENRTPWCHPQLYKNYMPKVMQGISSRATVFLVDVSSS